MDVHLTATISELEEEMLTAANNLEFEKAALCRDQTKELKRVIHGSQPSNKTERLPARTAGYSKRRKSRV